MKIIVDAFGGDNAPLEIIKGCALAVEEYKLNIILVGDKNIIEKVSKENSISLNNIEIVNTNEIITMNDSADSVIKTKKNSSMAVGLKLLHDGKGDAFVSAGNSGALAMGATFLVKRIRGIKRCAFAPVLPKNNGVFMLIDSGANLDCRPEMLSQFGLMGSIYMNKVMNISNPRVGLANVGTEEHKGTELQHKTYTLLNDSNLNFVGNIEARDIPNDAADVVVCDGFTGNIILKMYEGVALTLLNKIKGIFKKNIKTKLAAALVLPDMRELKKQVDYNEFGGAPILGVSKPVFKAHGSAKSKTIKNAIKMAAIYVKNNVVDEITEEIFKTKVLSTDD